MPTWSLDTFAKRAPKIGKKIDDNIDEAHRAVALAAVQAVAVATPHDTGLARSNWQLSSGQPASGTLPTDGPGFAGVVGSVSRAQAAIMSHTKGATLWISNNLPYIARLNEGWSSQAPAGFIEAAINAAKAAVKNIRLLKGI